MPVVPFIVFAIVLFLWTRALLQESAAQKPSQPPDSFPEESVIKAVLEALKKSQEQ